ncbi:TerD family protein [Butyrivibrio sp. VCB2001]|uniref:TerD family protein n=1 Tax=Butyrivibrio sp. VCB2001 TaxID=1280667 RepID=UPI0003FDAAEA|nr:TerD family protein [Butyrivibrio sp. VCB2001]
MDKTAVELHSKGTITISINWNQYDRQRAGGMLTGLLNKDSGDIDCDTSAFLVKKNNKEMFDIIEVINYENPTGINSVIVHHGDNAVKGGEKEQISVNLGGLSEGDAVIITLDTFKDKNQVKTGKLSHISISINDSESKTELYGKSFSGMGDKAISIGKIICNEGKYYYVHELKALNDVKKKEDIINVIRKRRH